MSPSSGATGVCRELGWNKSCIDVKVGAHYTIPWPKWDISAMEYYSAHRP